MRPTPGVYHRDKMTRGGNRIPGGRLIENKPPPADHLSLVIPNHQSVVIILLFVFQHASDCANTPEQLTGCPLQNPPQGLRLYRVTVGPDSE